MLSGLAVIKLSSVNCTSTRKKQSIRRRLQNKYFDLIGQFLEYEYENRNNIQMFYERKSQGNELSDFVITL